MEFQQIEVKKYIPPGHTNKLRFSWSLQSPKSVCSYLARDYRFLKHYHKLLEREFPEKKEKFKEEIYQFYKELVINREKFDRYFAYDKYEKSIKQKSVAKNFDIAKSVKKA